MMRTYSQITTAGPDAPWLTLVHAMTQDHRVFDMQIDAFRDRYRILLVDLPGHGLATPVPGPYGHLEMMNHLRAALDDSGIGESHFWATHTGTAVGLLLALREPWRFRSLVLEGAVVSGFPMPYVSETLAQAAQTARASGIRRAIHDVFYQADWYQVMRDHPEQCRAEAHLRILKDFAGAPWLETRAPAPVEVSDAELSGFERPVLLYNGEHDLADFIAVADHLERLLPHAERVLVPQAGGFPAWEFPLSTNRLVGGFLDRQRASRDR